MTRKGQPEGRCGPDIDRFAGVMVPLVRLLLTAALTAAIPASVRAAEQDTAPPNIVLLVLDTLRADHLGCYGNTRGLTPFIDSMAADGVRFEQVISQSSWTKTTMASIFTARNPASHGILVRADKMAGNATLLAERLKARGYHCLGIQTNPWLTRKYGFHQGFDEYHYLEPKSSESGPIPAYVHASRVVRFTTRRMARNLERPLFLYVHFMDPHAPYKPPADYCPEEPADEHMLYQGEIRFLDDQLRELCKQLGEAGLDRNTLHVLVSDHGEEFAEHGGTGHGQTLYREVLHVPLILSGDPLGPYVKKMGISVKQIVRLIDLAPTLLEITGVPSLTGVMEGQSLLPMIDAWRPADRSAFSQLGLNFDPQKLDEFMESYALTTGREKLIRDVKAGSEEYYRTDKDREELMNLAGSRSRAADKLMRRLESYINSARDGSAAEKTDPAAEKKDLDQLRALGYITDDQE